MRNLLEHAKYELSLLRGDGPDDTQDEMDSHILRMVEEFAKEGHSGFSASYANGLLSRLLKYEPITPLTGEDSEWNGAGDGLLQNNRCSYVFKDLESGEAYNIQGNVFRNQYGCCFTSKYSAAPVVFPWSPPEHPNYVDIWESPKKEKSSCSAPDFLRCC